MTVADRIRAHFADNLEVHQRAMDSLLEPVTRAAGLLSRCLGDGGKVLSCGNGGSASDSQHFAAELLNRFEMDRPGLPAVDLTATGPTLTAIANDAAYNDVFSRQVEALGQAGDCLLAISTSGNSSNVLAAVAEARRRQLPVIALTGRDGGKLAAALGADDVEIRVPDKRTARIQEVHILVIHCLCDAVDATLFGGAAD